MTPVAVCATVTGVVLDLGMAGGPFLGGGKCGGVGSGATLLPDPDLHVVLQPVQEAHVCPLTCPQ